MNPPEKELHTIARRRGLGFHPGPVDERDYPLAPRLASIRQPRTTGSQLWRNRHRLDQSAEGACVLFAWTQRINAAPKLQNLTNADAFALYDRARQIDEWPGEDYDGTSVRAGAKAVMEKGLITAYAFTYSVQEIAMWILNKGPLVIGVDWYEGMDTPNRANDYYITPTGQKRGGHAVCVDGVNWTRDNNAYFSILNSWSGKWGDNGRAKISISDFFMLMSAPYAVAATATEA